MKCLDCGHLKDEHLQDISRMDDSHCLFYKCPRFGL